jgi:hypothetical protein
MDNALKDPVECYSGGIYAERPRALTWEGRRLEVEYIISRWRTPGKRGFKVRVTGGQRFDLTYDEGRDAWLIQPV